MSTGNQTKINRLISTIPKGAVVTSAWLTQRGYSLDLQKRYRKGGWLQPIGTGAMRRSNDKVTVEGGVFALQKQLNLTVHPGGKTALMMQGKSHYLQFSTSRIILFGQQKETLPKWFRDYDWGMCIDYHSSNLLLPDIGMSELEFGDFMIRVSTPARALMECLSLYPREQDLGECLEIMESLNNLRPDVVSELLSLCTSVKVKRLFVYLAEKAGHGWFKYLTLDGVDFGQGKRSLTKKGVYIPKYRITVPRELEQ